MLALLQFGGNPIAFVFSFIVFLIVCAILIIGIRWLASLLELAPNSPPVILVTLFLVLCLLCGGYYYGWHR